MKKRKKYFNVILIAVFTVCALSAVSYVTIKHFKLGNHATFNVAQENEEAKRNEMMVLDGLLYDKQGNKINIKTLDFETIAEKEYYDQNGIRVVFDYDNEAGKFVLINYDDFLVEQGDIEDVSTHYKTLEEVKPYLAFDFVFPNYIPSNYEIDSFRVFKDDFSNDESLPEKNTKYLTIIYKNKEDIIVEQKTKNEIK